MWRRSITQFQIATKLQTSEGERERERDTQQTESASDTPKEREKERESEYDAATPSSTAALRALPVRPCRVLCSGT